MPQSRARPRSGRNSARCGRSSRPSGSPSETFVPLGRHDGAEHVRLVGRGEQSGLLLSVKDDVDRGVLALLEVVAGTRKAQYPRAPSILADDENDAVGIRRRRGTMRKGSRFVIAERAANPVAYFDAAEWPGRLRNAANAQLQ